MRKVAIVQARMGSSRLPGKVLADLNGASMLARVVGRLLDAETLDEVVIATSVAASDDAIESAARKLGVAISRGSEHDVLGRFVQAAHAHRADVIVRATADCPLLDPGVIDRVVGALTDDIDYASNTHVRTYPRGLDVEAFHADTLMRINRLGKSPAAREHVTAYLLEQPALFRVCQVMAEHDDSHLRWTVDTDHDLALVRTIYALFDLDREIMPYRELVAAVRARPGLASLNAHVIQKGWQESCRST